MQKSKTSYRHQMRRHNHNDHFTPRPHLQRKSGLNTATKVTYHTETGAPTATKLLGEKEHIKLPTAYTRDLYH